MRLNSFCVSSSIIFSAGQVATADENLREQEFVQPPPCSIFVEKIAGQYSGFAEGHNASVSLQYKLNQSLFEGEIENVQLVVDGRQSGYYDIDYPVKITEVDVSADRNVFGSSFSTSWSYNSVGSGSYINLVKVRITTLDGTTYESDEIQTDTTLRNTSPRGLLENVPFTWEARSYSAAAYVNPLECR